MFEQTLAFFQQSPTAFNIFVIIFSLIIGSFFKRSDLSFTKNDAQ
jgi:hypothetical protein